MSIAVATQQPLANTSALSTYAVNTSKRITHPHNFLFLVPTITGIAIGLLFLPNFGLGLAIGAGELIFNVVSISLLSEAGILKHANDKNSEYAKSIRKSLLEVSLFGPIVEEGIFRGFIQPLLTKSILILVPAATAALFGTGLRVATAISILATSVIFGAAHYLNPHKNTHIQAISCTINGLVLGILSAQFGIGASIAAHIANNSIISAIIAINPSDVDCNCAHRQKKFELPNLPT